MNTNLSVTFCGVQFPNPFVVASSPCTDSKEMIARAFEAGWGGVVLKTTSTAETEVDMVYPIISGFRQGTRLLGLHNIDLISERCADLWAEDIRSLKRDYPDRVVIGSIVGDSKADWQYLAQVTAQAGADIIECSLSCPQGSAIEGEEITLGSMVSQDPHLTQKVAGWIKSAVPDTPIVVKLTSGVTDLTAMVHAVQASGADGVCLIDSVEAVAGVDLDTLEPMPSVQGYSAHGGYSGRAIKPIALRCVADAAQASSLPISGVGGVYSWRDAVEYLLLGATTVQVCTAVMEMGFDIVGPMKEGLSQWLAGKGFESVQQVIGLALPRLVEHEKLPRGVTVRARIDLTKCIGCRRCYIACRDGGHQAIEWNAVEKQPQVNDAHCVGCGLCPQVCPVPKCIALVNA